MISDSPFLWVDSTIEPNYLNWAENEPDISQEEYCGEVLLSTGQWADDNCDDYQGFVCKMNICKEDK